MNTSPPSVSARLSKQNKHIIAQQLNHHRLYAFAVPKSKKGDLQHYATQFAKEDCEKGRSTLLGEILRTFSATEYSDLQYALSYPDNKGNLYSWKHVDAEQKIGIKYKPNGTIDILVPKELKNREHLLFIGHKDVSEPGFAGGQLLYIKKDGSIGFANNSNYDKPSFSRNVIYLNQEQMQTHMVYAHEAGKAHLKGKEFIMTDSQTHVGDIQTVDLSKGAVAKLNATRAQQPNDTLPNHIKVTAANDAPIFELHCAPFKETNCLDANDKPFTATVYVLKKIGSNFDKDKSQALMLEVSDDGGIYVRSGTRGDRAVSAKVTVRLQNKLHTAILSEKNGEAVQNYDKSQDSPFKTPSNPTFMCVRGCSGHYSEENKRLMENPALANQKAM